MYKIAQFAFYLTNKLDEVNFVQNLLTFLFLHVISKFVQTHLKQYIENKLENFWLGIHFQSLNSIVWLFKLNLMRCILIHTVAVFWNYLFKTN